MHVYLRQGKVSDRHHCPFCKSAVVGSRLRNPRPCVCPMHLSWTEALSDAKGQDASYECEIEQIE